MLCWLPTLQRGVVPGGRRQQREHGGAGPRGAHRARHAPQERLPPALPVPAGRVWHPAAAAARPVGAGLGQQQCPGWFRNRRIEGHASSCGDGGERRPVSEFKGVGGAHVAAQVGINGGAKALWFDCCCALWRHAANANAACKPIAPQHARGAPSCALRCSLSERAGSVASPVPPAGSRRSTGADSHRSWSRADSEQGEYCSGL